MSDELLKQIKSRGYWRINFRPLIQKEELELSDCQKFVKNSSVRLRGWGYPHFPSNKSDLKIGNNYCEGRVDWEGEKEIWRLYRSGQFIHFLGLGEDWQKKAYGNSGPGEVLSFIGMTYQITEIFEFLSRLAKEGLYEKGVKVHIRLENTKERKIEVFNSRRLPLGDQYTCDIKTINLEQEFKQKDIIKHSSDAALKSIIKIFERFHWNTPPKEVIKNDQKELLEGLV